MTVPVGVETDFADPDADETADTAVEGEAGSPSPVTPWSDKQQRDTQPKLGPPTTAPGANGQPQQQNPPASAQPTPAPPGTPAPGSGTAAAPQSTPAPAPAPGVAAGQPNPPPVVAAPATTAPPPEPAAPLVDPDMISALAPAAISAGTMAMGMLPMIASALAGLGSGGGSGNGGGDTGEAATGALSPESQKALEVLKLLKDVYGDGEATSPEVKELRKELGVNESGAGSSSGTTARAVKARQLYQANAHTAFNNLDNQLARYVMRIAGDNKVDKKAVVALLREVNVALAQLGTEAYTKAGQQKVHQILAAALAKAQAIVSGGQASSAETAKAIKLLTNQYLYNIAGQKYNAGITTGTGSGSNSSTSSAANAAIQVALGKLGVPYVWGGTGPNSFDCSGLMQYAAAKAGVKIPRVADDQFDQLPQVNPADIRPGDLIFPNSSYKNGEFGHVMMYVGNGRCVEAPHTGANVRVTNLPSGYRATRWS
ncbi:C40 family peptidase [Nocardia callitridis]|uniref:NlpC/P60 domain-containing protein n=1 Tax=Nocardia callitridis TaxID=648753 RepID=A0ABP9KRB6_9NOCA